MQLGIIGIILALVLAGGAVFFTISEDSDKAAMEKAAMDKEAMEKEAMQKDAMMKDDAMEGDAMMKKDDAMQERAMPNDEAMMKDEVMMKDDAVTSDAMMMKDDAMTDHDSMMMKGSIQTYSPDKLTLAEHGKVLLFFHAAWCPICRQLDAEAAANPNIVPDGITIMKVDFDNATELRQKYGVTVQHTFVQVDASGALVKKFSDASKYATVFSRVQ